ncbi:beta-glucosidase [Deinococcus metalli]|uniref:Beta-glucosidase n=1 Tax=Deinococcus metalli TaxID=1141878 RepID=A0A7W8KG55_9DEIO|nr:GH1 family beta-glucosidase [Deinococcus metalli]MBB5377485.1 beta-glucosidase [Deinococcus metalli]GHF50785.1 beta-glucosidase [Deinococcus metalli]
MAQFPSGFVWGAATASYQIEGAVHEDGRGASIWDTFAHTPGKVKQGDTGDVACDHYHRFREDVALMRDLGLNAYRFSVAWPRVQPDGRGRVNAAGLAFYDRLVDELLAAGLQPWATLFHWDLPQALEDRGGWLARDTAHRFEEYAYVVGERLADRVTGFMTLNEPFIHFLLGHALGTHAPGHTLGLHAFPAAHHQLLGHGLAVRALREAGANMVGIANNYAPVWPAGDRDADLEAMGRVDALHNHLFTDPLIRGEYPALALDVVRGTDAALLDVIQPGDLTVMAAPLDFLGVNYYQPDYVRAGAGPLGVELGRIPDREYTASSWPVVPEGLTQTLTGLKARYGETCPPLYVTESGCSVRDVVGPDGRVRDDFRIRYHEAHVDAVRDAITQGAEVRGYFVWSLLDNFEWAEGFSQRFGLVHVDYATQARTPKDSYRWFQTFLKDQG